MRMRSVSLRIRIMALVIFLAAGLVAAFSWTAIRVERAPADRMERLETVLFE